MDDMKTIPCKRILVPLIIALFWVPVNIVSVRADAASKKIIVFGDSLVAGYGIPLEKAFPAQLEGKLREQGYNISVINAGVSGDTTSGGLTRLEWMLEQQKPDFVILELGGNDMLRAVDPAVTRGNLQKMLEILKERKIPVLLAGMKATPNLGEIFIKEYTAMYRDLAKKYHAIYYPFFMEGVALHSELVQEDGLHPRAEGAAVIVDRIMPSVKKLLKSAPK
jgi:acyl-CoA thioesterase-1